MKLLKNLGWILLALLSFYLSMALFRGSRLRRLL